MEEKKKKAREVKMPAQQEKLSYEELEKVASQLNQQCQALYQKLQEAQGVINSFNDVGMLLSILKQSEYFDEEFIKRCAGKVEETVSNMLDSVEKPEE